MFSQRALKSLAIGSSWPRRFSSEAAGRQRISLALYRQLIRWCNETDDDIPLSTLVPPVYMKVPHLDLGRLGVLSDQSRISFPANSIIESDQITCPIRTPVDVRDFFRSVFRLNSKMAEDANVQKKRITLAFEGIRSLNELSRALQSLQQNRAKHVLRDGVNFKIGQVVKHKKEEWRGVVIGWHRIETTGNENKGDPTSLTQKAYELGPDDSVRFTILLDSGDAHIHNSKRRDSTDMSQAEVLQSELELVEEPSLSRIRNTRCTQYFLRYDAKTQAFVANDIMSYEYPSDVDELTAKGASTETKESEKIAQEIITGAEEIGDHLRRIILDYTSAPESRKLDLLSHFLRRLLQLSGGDVLPGKDRLTHPGISKGKLASGYLQKMISVSEDIGDLLWQHRRYMEAADRIHFSVGDIVKHKQYGFRGVIVATDPEPVVDVSRWDGLRDIKNPEAYPFYHIIPDQGDCVKAFGGERPSRYVCEANLEICPVNERNIDVDLEPEWKYNASDRAYIPPADIRFKNGADLEDDGITKQCLVELRDSLTKTLVAIRDGTSTGSADLDSTAAKLSVSNIMSILKEAEDLDTASTVSDCLKEVWRAHLNGEIKFQLDEAIESLLSGKTEDALAIFTDLINEDPGYAEAWNKASTCEYMLGNLEASLAAAQKALEIIPTHFQAQNGLGLVYFEKKEFPSAIDCFRKSLYLDPWSPVSSRLSLSLDTVKKWESLPGPKKV